MWKTAAHADGKEIYWPMEMAGISHRPANIFPTASLFWQFTHIPTTPTAATYTYPILSKREYEKSGRTANRTIRKAVRPFCV